MADTEFPASEVLEGSCFGVSWDDEDDNDGVTVDSVVDADDCVAAGAVDVDAVSELEVERGSEVDDGVVTVEEDRAETLACVVGVEGGCVEVVLGDDAGFVTTGCADAVVGGCVVIVVEGELVVCVFGGCLLESTGAVDVDSVLEEVGCCGAEVGG